MDKDWRKSTSPQTGYGTHTYLSEKGEEGPPPIGGSFGGDEPKRKLFGPKRKYGFYQAGKSNKCVLNQYENQS